MNIEGKTKAVAEWVKTCPFIGKRLKINAVDMKAGEVALNTVSNTQLDVEFIDGTKEKAYTFALVFVREWSDGVDKINQEAVEFGEKWQDWVSEQLDAGNVPNFGNRCTIRAIKPLQNIPDVAAVYGDVQKAQYQFQCEVTYWEERG